MNEIAAIIPSYNMDERADALVERLCRTDWPLDLILVDNGSDIRPPSKYTTLALSKNVQTTGAWRVGLEYARMLAHLRGHQHLAYLFMITSAEITTSEDFLTRIASFLMQNPNPVAVHPSLTEDSTTMWNHLKRRSTGPAYFRRTWMVDNIASVYRASWFDEQPGGRFDPRLIYAHGIDLEACWQARMEGRGIYVYEGEEPCIRKITNIGYTMDRMNMTAKKRAILAQSNMDDVLGTRYGRMYWSKLATEGVEDEWL